MHAEHIAQGVTHFTERGVGLQRSLHWVQHVVTAACCGAQIFEACRNCRCIPLGFEFSQACHLAAFTLGINFEHGHIGGFIGGELVDAHNRARIVIN